MRNMTYLPRRRAISIFAAAAALPLTRGAAWASPSLQPFRWQGAALGVKADMTLFAADRGQAGAAIEACLDQIVRLEAVFSLYRPDSALARLNRDGRLASPPLELVDLLSQALRLSELSAGRFDPTVQPLWRLFADHFAMPGADPAGPPAEALAAARATVDYRAVQLTAGAIELARPGMQLTLNGIAQGYIGDGGGRAFHAPGLAPGPGAGNPAAVETIRRPGTGLVAGRR